MNRLILACLPLCLLLGCAPDRRDADSASPDVGPAAAVDTPAAQPDLHAHEHQTTVDVALARPPTGGNWPTDAALRQGMQAVHAALAQALPAFERGELTAPAANALAGVVTSQVQFLLANCKLEPQADAQLHIVIGQMMSAAEAMVGDAASVDGVPRLHQAVQLYGDYFEHPGLHEPGSQSHQADAEPATTAPEADKLAQ